MAHLRTFQNYNDQEDGHTDDYTEAPHTDVTISLAVKIKISTSLMINTLILAYKMKHDTVYIPCVWAIAQQVKQKNCATCYIFMFYLGIVDSIGLLIPIPCGIHSIKGLVYCQLPVLDFCISDLGLFCWYAGNSTTLVLAINRCLVIYDNDLCDRLFKGRRGTLWLIFPTVAGLGGVWTTPPFMYNPMDSSALYNPHRHYLPDNEFVGLYLIFVTSIFFTKTCVLSLS
ncbi:serpentine type 7TM GPCR chemoreceptor srt domain-containing protein [Ditylenchus destructor]|nr:serpentine type 7TM GPCR chemoreceptor srt domain-containing protein [Ditylenchus destructor]